MWTTFLMYSGDNFITFLLTEIAILKCLYIKNWSRMVHVDDYFLASFLGLFNTMIIFLKMSISIGLGEIEATDVFMRTSGLNVTLSESQKQLAAQVFTW